MLEVNRVARHRERNRLEVEGCQGVACPGGSFSGLRWIIKAAVMNLIGLFNTGSRRIIIYVQSSKSVIKYNHLYFIILHKIRLF